MANKSINFSALFVGLFLTCSLIGSEISSILEKIPEADQRAIDRFFQLLTRDNHPCGYTLFGRKPMSVADVPLAAFNRPNCQITAIKGWEAWLRSQKLFPAHDFVLKLERTPDLISFWLIHKPNVTQTVVNNIDLFESHFGHAFDVSQFVEKLCDPRTSITDLLLTNDILGLLLGYGRENGVAYHQEIWKSKICNDTPKRSFELPGIDYSINFFDTPAFCVYLDDSELQQQYQKDKERIRHAYRDTPFLQATLKQWMNPNE